MHKTVNATPERLAKGDVTEVYVQEHQNLPPEKRLRSSGRCMRCAVLAQLPMPT
ncbi:MAG: hypothetical protein ABF739_11910 [Acetobacter okinawensis]|uniref:hypothetical protein n=1 Tax=Acetobacter okinawensis TaxID=1076594 RepID=UPI0039E9AD7E